MCLTTGSSTVSPSWSTMAAAAPLAPHSRPGGHRSCAPSSWTSRISAQRIHALGAAPPPLPQRDLEPVKLADAITNAITDSAMAAAARVGAESVRRRRESSRPDHRGGSRAPRSATRPARSDAHRRPVPVRPTPSANVPGPVLRLSIDGPEIASLVLSPRDTETLGEVVQKVKSDRHVGFVGTPSASTSTTATV